MRTYTCAAGNREREIIIIIMETYDAPKLSRYTTVLTYTTDHSPIN